MHTNNKNGLVRFDSTGHFQIIDEQLITELGPQDVALVSAGAIDSNVQCGTNGVCVNGGCLHVNGLCDTDGHKQLLTHGNHTLNGVC